MEVGRPIKTCGEFSGSPVVRPSRPRRGIASPVAIRRGEGAQRKRCRDRECSPRGNPAFLGTFGPPSASSGPQATAWECSPGRCLCLTKSSACGRLWQFVKRCETHAEELWKIKCAGWTREARTGLQEVSCEADVMQVRNGVFHFLELL